MLSAGKKMAACKCRIRLLATMVVLCIMLPGRVCSQRTPRFDYFYIEASKCMRAGDYASANELFGHCLEMDSMAAEAVYSVGMLRLAKDMNDSVGVEMLEKACRMDSMNADYLTNLSRVYLLQRNTGKEIDALERLSRLRKNRSDVLDRLADLYEGEGQPEKAIVTLDRMELLDGVTYDITMKKSGIYGDMELHDSVLAVTRRLCVAYPRNTMYRAMLSGAYVDAGEVQKARDILEQMQETDPQSPGLLMGWLYLYQKTDQARYGQMRDSILLAKSDDKDMRDMLLNEYMDDASGDSVKGRAFEALLDTLINRPECDVKVISAKAVWQAKNQKDKSEIAQTMKQILAKDPGNEIAIRWLVMLYIKTENLDGLEDVCRRGVNYRQGELIYPYYLAQVLIQKNNYKEAVAVLEQGVRTREEGSDRELVSDAFSALGDIYHSQGQEELSFAAYDSSLVYNKDNVGTLNNYAYFLSLTGKQLDLAEEMSYKTVISEPRNVIYLDTYAWILFTKGKFTEARVYMNRAVDTTLDDEQLKSNKDLNGNILEHAGDIHARCGDMEQALRMWQMAKDKNDGTCSKRITSKIKKRKYLE